MLKKKKERSGHEKKRERERERERSGHVDKNKKLGGHYGKTALRKFSLIAFPLDLGGKILWAQGKFSP